MAVDTGLVTICGLLHDIGKVCQRASGTRQTHAQLGADFLKKLLTTKESASRAEEDSLLQAVNYHHARALKGAGLQSDSLAYIVYEADNIAAGTDRREREEGEGDAKLFSPHLQLENIFNIFNPAKQGEKSYFSLRVFDAEEELKKLFPSRMDNPEAATAGQYQAIVEVLKANFALKSPLDMTPAELLRILEDTMSYVPSSTNKGEIADISLFDHSRMTGAIAATMLQYFAAAGMRDYREACFSEKTGMNREREMFRLLAGDFSGIQRFIYHIPTKGAMRLLRGRSFYLEAALESMVDELLEKLQLSRANLIFCGGGRFYILAANTKETETVFADGISCFNRQLAEFFQLGLYLAGASVAVSAAELMGQKAEARNMFERASLELSKKKLRRYETDTLTELFDEHSVFNMHADGDRECALCHASYPAAELAGYLAAHLEAPKAEEAEPMEVCPVCNSLYRLGQLLVEDDTVFAVLNEAGRDVVGAVQVPTLAAQPRFLAAVPLEQAIRLGKKTIVPSATSLAEAGVLGHLYDRNQARTSEHILTRLWVADYAARDEKKDMVLDFQELAEESGDGEDGRGIKRLGVLRADVDWLGAAFMAGFNGARGDRPALYATVSRYAALSRSLAFFFKYIINGIAQGELPTGQTPFALFGEKTPKKRPVHIVYSGGDDLFVVGAWDELLEFAVDIRRAFAIFTNGKLSFSAGLGLFSVSYPISRMALEAGALEDVAKGCAGKDSIALWGISSVTSKDGRLEPPHFSWTELEKKVIGEKLAFLTAHLQLEGINDAEVSSARIVCGKSLLYRLLMLLPVHGERFNLARFAYTLARMEPKKSAEAAKRASYQALRGKLYSWSKDKADREQLAAAINMIIYRMREK